MRIHKSTLTTTTGSERDQRRMPFSKWSGCGGSSANVVLVMSGVLIRTMKPPCGSNSGGCNSGFHRAWWIEVQNILLDTLLQCPICSQSISRLQT